MPRLITNGSLLILSCIALVPQIALCRPPVLRGDRAEELRAKIMERYDKDHDGRLNDEERVELRKDVEAGRVAVPPALRERLLNAVAGGQSRPRADRAKEVFQGELEKLKEKVLLEKEVEYAKAGDVSLKLDIAYPKQSPEKPLPLVVFIHGGGWRAGDKSVGYPHLLPFVASGQYVCASINYRLSDVAIWPAQIHDCKAAIRFLKANAGKYHLDPAKVGVWGSSAGGHLVSLLGTSGDVTELEGELGPLDQSSRVTCVVDFCGPSDFTRIRGAADAARPVTQLLGGTIDEKPAEAKAASPVTYASKDDPPFLIMHGTADPLVPLQQAEEMYEVLKQAGVDATLVKVDGGGHGFGGPKVHERVAAFFEKCLQGKDVTVASDPIPAK
jgi:acetyl esterase/lipase